METYQEPFLHEKNAKRTNIEEKDGFLLVELDDTIFYPAGGGQPCDTGIIKNNYFEGKVVDVSKKDDKIIHKIKVIDGTLKHVGPKMRLRLVEVELELQVSFKKEQSDEKIDLCFETFKEYCPISDLMIKGIPLKVKISKKKKEN